MLLWGEREIAPGTRKPLALLCHVLTRGRPLPRSELSELLVAMSVRHGTETIFVQSRSDCALGAPFYIWRGQALFVDEQGDVGAALTPLLRELDVLIPWDLDPNARQGSVCECDTPP